MSEVAKLLSSPPVKRVLCPTCAGSGRVRLNACRVARECPTCRSSGVFAYDTWEDVFDRRAYEVGLAPVLRGARAHD